MKSRFQNLRHWLRSANLLEFLGAIPALQVQRKGVASQGESFLTVGTTGRPGGGSRPAARNNLVGLDPRALFHQVSQSEMFFLKAVGVSLGITKGEEDLGLKLLAAWYVL